jgi:hypothetical protein
MHGTRTTGARRYRSCSRLSIGPRSFAACCSRSPAAKIPPSFLTRCQPPASLEAANSVSFLLT